MNRISVDPEMVRSVSRVTRFKTRILMKDGTQRIVFGHFQEVGNQLNRTAITPYADIHPVFIESRLDPKNAGGRQE